MPPVIDFRERAEIDLYEIGDFYTDTAGKETANTMLARLFDEIQKLAENPLLIGLSLVILSAAKNLKIQILRYAQDDSHKRKS